jgi:anti-sigma-K factor RskA
VTERRDIRDLVGDDVPEEELAELARVDALLRSVPPPASEVPAALTRAITGPRSTSWRPRRLAIAVGIAAALAALSFGVGSWLSGGDDFDARGTIPMQATDNARGASALIRLGPPKGGGNWELELETVGLPKLPEGGYYVLWLSKDGEYAATCGTFAVGSGKTTVRMNAPYRLADYDAWVVTAVVPGQDEDADPPWLLKADIARA